MEKHPYVYFSQNLSLITHTIKLINAATNPLSLYVTHVTLLIINFKTLTNSKSKKHGLKDVVCTKLLQALLQRHSDFFKPLTFIVIIWTQNG